MLRRFRVAANGSGSVIFAKVQSSGLTYPTLRAQTIAHLTPLYGEGEARALTWYLLEWATDLDRATIVAQMYEPVANEVAAKLKEGTRRVAAGEPVQYVTGYVDFGPLRIRIGPGALIPRPETEQLVDDVARYRKQKLGFNSIRVMDVCTGSGCIALAYKALCRGDAVIGIDLSTEALAWARLNATESKLDVAFQEADATQTDTLPDGPFDIILSNPPYVPAADLAALAPNVREHEPHQALFVPDDDPLRFYHHLLAYAQRVLTPGGLLAVELYADYAEQVATLFTEGGLRTEIREDFAGKNRFVWAHL